MNCPRCGCGRVSSNKLQPVSEENFARGVHAARASNMPALAVGVMAAWAINRGVNALRHDHRCDHCNHRFS